VEAAIYPGHGKGILIEELPDPRPNPDDLIIKVHRCGICGTDLSMTRGGLWNFGVNTQFGHEYAGEIVEIGARVTGFRVGERIAVLPSPACGNCEACRSHGNHVLCQNKLGTTMVGFAELARVPAGLATRLPNTLSMADGALIEPLAISLYGVKLARIDPGDRVLVLGGGTVALYAIYWARRLGAGRIVAMSRSDRRRGLALQMGANSFIAYGENEVGDVKEALGGAPQLVFECVGAEGMLSKAVRHVAQFGRIVSLGFCTAPDPIIPAMASYKCASIQFAVGYSMREFIYIADQMDKGHTDPKAIITCDIALAELPAMIEQLRAPNMETKVHVRL
jgi:(R,R)-butanediol dehydrogenase/meso-butanediol dehydrogenase/diacetyl reductase